MTLYLTKKLSGLTAILLAFISPAIGQTIDTVCYNTAPAAFISNTPASGGDNVYTYLWQDSTATGSWQAASGTNNALVYQPSTLTETTYFRRQVSSAACGISNSNVLTVMVLDLFDSTSTSVSNVLCNGGSNGSITVNVSGGLAPYSYAWSSGGSTTNSNTGLSAGTYTVSVSDSKLCDTLIYSFTVSDPAALMASTITDSNVSCNSFTDGGATASSTGGTMPYTYAWSNSATSASITGIAAGTYSVTITDANGCTDSTSVTITEPASLVASSVVDSNVSCNSFTDGGGTASATGGTMPYTYTWSNSASSASITGVAAGTYSVTITDANGCTDSSSVTITEPALLIASSIVDSNVSCNSFTDGGATGSATGGTMPYTYNWSTSSATASITGVGAAAYSVTITDANGCTATSSVTITEPTLLVASVNLDSAIKCFDQMDGGITAQGNGGTSTYTFLWNTGGTAASLTSLDTGTYVVTITDGNGCSDTTSIALTQPDSISITLTSTNVTCNAGMDGAISSVVSGGTPTYSYSWNSGSSGASINSVIAGNYMVTVTDNNGCVKTASSTVTEPLPLDGGMISTGN